MPEGGAEGGAGAPGDAASKLHLRNLSAAAELGCAIVPPMLTFYNGADTMEKQIHHVVGKDLAVLLSRGERPHIGCTVVAVPRASLTGDGSVSCTSSVLNLTGHKDEALCRMVAETLCRKYGVTVTCTGGFYQDNITREQITEVRAALALSERECEP